MTGGARAHAQLNEAFIAIAAQFVLRPQAVVCAVHEKMRDGRFADEETLAFLGEAVEDLLRNIARGGGAITEAPYPPISGTDRT